MDGWIAVMLDDILNEFTAALGAHGVEYDPERHSISERKYRELLYTPEGTLTRLGEQVLTGLPVRPAGAAFFRWLKARGNTVVLCTDRDIRLTYAETTGWLAAHGVEYDYLFTATAPARFCEDMGTALLVYNLPVRANSRAGAAPAWEDRFFAAGAGPGGGFEVLGTFGDLEDVKAWMQKRKL